MSLDPEEKESDIGNFYKDYDNMVNSKNLKLLVDELENIGLEFTGLETFPITPLKNKEKVASTIDIRNNKNIDIKTLF